MKNDIKMTEWATTLKKKELNPDTAFLLYCEAVGIRISKPDRLPNLASFIRTIFAEKRSRKPREAKEAPSPKKAATTYGVHGTAKELDEDAV